MEVGNVRTGYGNREYAYTKKEKKQEKDFQEVLTGRQNMAAGKPEDEENKDYRAFLKQKTEEILAKLQNGDTEIAYQIGARFFTEKEWDAMLAEFDSVQDELRELMRERHEKQEAKQRRREEAMEAMIKEASREALMKSPLP